MTPPTDRLDPRIVALDAAEDAARFGGKAAALARALGAGLPVPRGLALSTALVDDIAAGDAAAARLLDLRAAAALISPVVVRSSAVGEDGVRASFAGIHRTELAPRSLAEAVAAVWRSARSQAARGYRRHRGLADEPRMAVVIQALVPADVAGVLFTSMEKTGQRHLIVECVAGLGELVVSGEVIPERVVISMDGEVRSRTPGDQDIRLDIRDRSMVRAAHVRDETDDGALVTVARARALAKLARELDRVFTGEHDAEFAFHDRKLWLLQRRPVTA